MSNNMIEIVNSITKAIYNKHHGSGVDYGLRRDKEESEVILDGFGIKFVGNKLIITYNSEEKFENSHDPKFESKIDDTIEDIASAIKREYKKNGGKGSLSLTKPSEVVVNVETVNRRTIKVTAYKVYEIGNLKDVEGLSDEPVELSKEAEKAQKEFDKSQSDKKLEESYKKFLSLLPEGKLYG
jgi:hypothetical protein